MHEGKNGHPSSPITTGLMALEDEEEMPVEYFCGIGKCRPKCLQIFRSAKFFTFILSCYALVEGAIASGFIPAVITSIEQRYKLSATQLGSITAIFDAAVAFSIIFISYFGGRRQTHKPRWLGICLIVQGLGAIIFALPQFVFGEYQVTTFGGFLFESCGESQFSNSTVCDVQNSDDLALVFFYIGVLIMGFGAAPLFTIGTTFIDDIAYPKYVSIHIGLFYLCSIIGPAIGLGMAAGFLTLYVDPWRETELDLFLPSWVGAWWLCFIIGAGLSFITAIPFLMFPKYLPDSHLVRIERRKEMAKSHAGGIASERGNFKESIKSFPRNFCQVMMNPSFIFITLALVISLLIIGGFLAFGVKFYEVQFYYNSSIASIFSAGLGIPTALVGILLGSLLIFFAKSNVRHVLVICTILAIIGAPFLLVFLLGCPTANLAGLQVPYAGEDSNYRLTSGSDLVPTSSPNCASSCLCTSSIYEPVCGADGVTYFSPCRAGCTRAPDFTSFVNCTCIRNHLQARAMEKMGNGSFNETMMTMQGEMGNVNSGQQQTLIGPDSFLKESVATIGACPQICNTLIPHIILSIIGFTILFIVDVPFIFVTIRCVADHQRTLALGIQGFFSRVLGSIPSPIVVGAIIDTVCLLFRFECNERGNCWVYDNHLLRVAMAIFGFAVVLLIAIFLFLTWLCYPKKNAYEEEMEAKEKKEAINPIPLMEKIDIKENEDGEIDWNVNAVEA